MLRIVRGRGWHCSFTRGCIYERLGPGYVQPGTNLVFCGVHGSVAEMHAHTQGAAGFEATLLNQPRHGHLEMRPGEKK